MLFQAHLNLWHTFLENLVVSLGYQIFLPLNIKYHSKKQNVSVESTEIDGEKTFELIYVHIPRSTEVRSGSTVDATILSGYSMFSGDEEATSTTSCTGFGESTKVTDGYDHRTKMVADSLTKMKSLGKQSSMVTGKGTWQGAAVGQGSLLLECTQNPDEFYWNEDLDEELSKSVESCDFDFSLIASTLKERCEQGYFGVLQNYMSGKIDSELCRKRFNYLEFESDQHLNPLE